MKRLILLIVFLVIGFYVVWPAFTGYRIYQGLEGNDPGILAAKIDFPSVRQSMRGPVLAQVNTRIESVMKDLGPATQLVGGQIPHDNIEKIIDGALATVVEPKRIAEIYANGGDINAAIKGAVLEEIDKMGGLVKVLKLDKLLTQGDEGEGSSTGASIGGIKIPGGLGKLLKSREVSEAIGNIAGKIALDPGKMAGKLFPPSGGSTGAAKPKDKPAYGFDNVKSFAFPSATAMQVGVARSPTAADPEVTAELAFRNYDWRVTKLIPNLLER